MEVPESLESAFSIALFTALIFLTIYGLTLLGSDEPSTVDAEFVDNGTVLAEVTLEVADTDAERRRGLMNRSSLDEDHGMLFVFDEPQTLTFWMKNTLIPLDMIFIDENKTVVNVETAQPEPGVADENLTVYSSESEAMYVIELNAGYAENHSIENGTRVEFELGH